MKKLLLALLLSKLGYAQDNQFSASTGLIRSNNQSVQNESSAPSVIRGSQRTLLGAYKTSVEYPMSAKQHSYQEALLKHKSAQKPEQHNRAMNLLDSTYAWRADTLTGIWSRSATFLYFYDSEYNNTIEPFPGFGWKLLAKQLAIRIYV